MRGVRTTTIEDYISQMDIYVPYMDIAFWGRMLTASSAIVTLDYCKKNTMEFTSPISVFTNTLLNILYVRQKR